MFNYSAINSSRSPLWWWLKWWFLITELLEKTQFDICLGPSRYMGLLCGSLVLSLHRNYLNYTTLKYLEGLQNHHLLLNDYILTGDHSCLCIYQMEIPTWEQLLVKSICVHTFRMTGLHYFVAVWYLIISSLPLLFIPGDMRCKCYYLDQKHHLLSWS